MIPSLIQTDQAAPHDPLHAELDAIAATVSAERGVPVDVLRSHARGRRLTAARVAFVRAARSAPILGVVPTMVELGQYLGGREHSSVCYLAGRPQ